MSKEKIVTPKFQANYAFVNRTNDSDKYSIDMVFDSEADLSKLKTMVEETAKEAFGTLKGIQMPFKDGNDKVAKDPERNAHLADMTIVTAQTQFKPGIVDADREPIIDEDDFYSGCYARASISAYSWTYLKKKGVSFNLNNLQKLADGEKLGGSRDAADDFESYEEEEI